MADGFVTPEAAPVEIEPEPGFTIWRSLDGSRVLIRVGYTDFELTAHAAGRLWRELANIEQVR